MGRILRVWRIARSINVAESSYIDWATEQLAMDLKRWLQVATRHQTVVVLVALLSTSAGADLLLNRPKSSELQWLGVPLLAFGAALFAWAVWPRGAAPVAIR